MAIDTEKESTEMDGQKGRTKESKRFEATLKQLLCETYNPPEPRAEFKASLLDALKERQAVAARAHKRRQRIRKVTFASAGMALAASLALVVGLVLSDPVLNNQQQNATPGTALANAYETSRASSAHGRVEGMVEVSFADNTFTPVTSHLRLDQPVKIRAADEQAGIEVRPGVRLVLEKGSMVQVDGERINVDHGLVSLRVQPSADPAHLAVDDYELTVKPGSWIGLDLADPSQYAEGGRPAPDVTLMEGMATVSNARTEAELQPGRVYRLHKYASMTDLRGQTLNEQRMKRNSAWVKPTLVNYMTSGGK